MAKNHDNHGEHHITPFSTYIKVFSILILLTIITVAASRINMGAMNSVIAMLIATVKAMIVVLWFMHMKYEDKLNRAVFGTAFFFAFVFYTFIAIDVFTRHNFANLFDNLPREEASHAEHH